MYKFLKRYVKNRKIGVYASVLCKLKMDADVTFIPGKPEFSNVVFADSPIKLPKF